MVADCAPMAGTGPRSRVPSDMTTGGAAMETGPFGVSTVARRSAGCWAKAAMSLTKP